MDEDFLFSVLREKDVKANGHVISPAIEQVKKKFLQKYGETKMLEVSAVMMSPEFADICDYLCAKEAFYCARDARKKFYVDFPQDLLVFTRGFSQK